MSSVVLVLPDKCTQILSIKMWWIVGSSSGRVKPRTIKLVLLLSTKHAELRSKSKDWLAQNQNVSEWNDMSTPACCFGELAL